MADETKSTNKSRRHFGNKRLGIKKTSNIKFGRTDDGYLIEVGWPAHDAWLELTKAGLPATRNDILSHLANVQSGQSAKNRG
jgi:hypothetical protein